MTSQSKAIEVVTLQDPSQQVALIFIEAQKALLEGLALKTDPEVLVNRVAGLLCSPQANAALLHSGAFALLPCSYDDVAPTKEGNQE